MEPSPDRTAEEFSRSTFRITTQRPVAILMVVMAVCVFGWVSYQRLALDLMPDIAYPTLTVRTEFPGTAPEEVETLISRPLERELGIVPHLVSISSISRAGQSDVVLEFEWDTDMNEASQDIREKVDRTRLPDDAEKPLLLRYDPSLDPILRIGLYADEANTLFQLRELAEEEIRRELESIPGVAAVKVKGGLEEEIHVSLSERRISLLGLDISAINQRLDQANVNLPGGQLREGQTEYLVRTLNEFASLQEISELIVTRNAGADIRLRDIADVSRGHKDREIITRVNGRESVELEIYKEADANIVAVATAVKQRIHGSPAQKAYVVGLDSTGADTGVTDSDEAVGEETPDEEADDAEADGKGEDEEGSHAAEEDEEAGEPDLKAQKREAARKAILHLQMTDFLSFQLPETVHLEILSDQSVFIVNSIEEVQRSALIGSAMAVVVLLIFLRNVLHTLVIAVTIPVSVIATFAPMFLFDVSLNIMSLGGLALGIGMLVDNSIVVLESIFRCREEGDDLLTATVRGTGEVGGAVFASTLTTIAVFFPIVFVEGVAGQVFGDMALTVVFSLLASLAVALFFIPMLASRRPAQTHALVDQLRQTTFLQPKARVRLRRALGKETDQFPTQRLREGALVIPQTLLDLAVRVGLALASLVVVIGKVLVAVVFQVVWPLVRLVEIWKRSEAGLAHGRFNRWMAETPPLRGLRDAVWHGLLDVTTLDLLATDMGRFVRWIWRRPTTWWRWIVGGLRLLLFPGVLAYLLVRFVLHSALSLVRAALVTAALLIALLIVLASGLISLLIVPVAAPILGLFQLGLTGVQNGYPVLLRAALKQRLIVIAGAAISFWVCFTQLVPSLGTELIPQVHQGEFNLELSMPVGTPLVRTAQVAEWVEGIAREIDGVDRVATTVGSDNSATSTADEGEHTARVTLRLVAGVTPDGESAIIEQLRRGLHNLPEVETEVSYPALFSFKTPIEVEIRGENLRTLRQLSVDAVGRISELPGLADVRSSLQVGHPELQIIYNRDRLAELGLDLRQVAELVRNKVQGRVATDFRRDERNVDVLVRLQQTDRLGVDELERLIVNPEGRRPIRLSSVAQILISEGPSEIRRIDQQRAALVTANIADIDLGTAANQIMATLQEADYPPGFSFLISGQREEMERSLDSLVFALLLAMFLVYSVMASQFESLIHPLVIMFTVPLAAIGAIGALYLKDVSLSIVVFIGFIMLAGIVVNNAIVLVDYINTLRRGGMDRTEAIVRAGSVRLRPILMTTLTTVLGLLPMALGLGDGAEIRTPMALTVIAGLLSSTFLTLVVIPTVYSLVDRGR